ncbi:MAG: helix-hairpin-helix domain-containing protein [Fimbriimonadaceae bacterium]|nr:helix-hairpin-helix domain-containing protein [Fimbriimonadaceae bacterium]
MAASTQSRYWLIALGAVIVVGAALYGENYWRNRGGIETDSSEPAQAILVEVTGAVVTPKLLKLSQPKKIAELVALCDGYHTQADLSAFDENTLIEESTVLSIPFRFPTSTSPVSLSNGAEGQIALVPGLDESIARRIVKERENHGPFLAIEDVMRVEGVTRDRFDQAKSYLNP